MEQHNETQDAIKLLVVEDEPFLRDLLLMKLNAEGINAQYTEDGEEALRIASEKPLDLILLDLILPGMNGFEILERLKSDDTTKDIPVMILSNLGQESDAKQCKDRGAVDVLVKAHSSPSFILNRIKEVVEENRNK